LDFNEPAGTVIRIRAMESVDAGGKKLIDSPATFNSCHAAPQNHTIIADGKPHSWHPRFSYHGFRYAEIHGLSKAPVAGQIKGLVVHTDTPVTATFKSSEPMLDRMFKMGIQTHLNNMHSILEDCPHREKCLWGGDLHASWATGFYTLDSASFYRQQARLYFTPPFGSERMPANIGVGRRGAAGNVRALVWSVSPVFIVWRMYEVHGDLQPFEDHYDMLKHFLEFFENDAPGLIPKQAKLADHANPLGVKRAPENKPMITTMHFYAAADRFSIMAKAAGKTADAKWSRDLAERIKAVILSEFYDEEKQSFGNGTQDSLALAFGLVPESQIDGVARSLAKVYQKNGNQFDGGFMSYNIYPQLAEHGNVDLALKTLLNPDYPGLAMSIRDFDATTIYERFWGLEKYDAQMKVSHDHHAMNHPTAWMLNYLAGIQRHPDSVGYRRLLLQPHIPEKLEWVEAEQQTAYGRVKSAWKQDAGKVTWSFSIPPNSVAEVRLPADIKNLHVQGKKVTGEKRNVEFVTGYYELTWE